MTPHTARALAACLILASTAAVRATPAPAAPPAAAPEPGTIVKIEHSSGKFDFLRVDARRNRLLAAHEKDETEDVIDLKSGRLLARLKVGGAVDTAADPESRYYYVSVQDPGRVAVIDAESLKEVKSVKTAGPTDAIIFEPKNHRVYVTHDDGAEVWVIDPATAKIIDAVAIPGVPEFMAYDEQTDRIYLNIKDKDLVAVIDPATNKVVKQWSTAPAHAPHGLAIDSARERIYSAGANGKLVAIDTRSGALAGSVDITSGVDQIAFDAAGGLVYCAGPGKLSMVRTAGGELTPVGSLATAASARNVAVDPTTREVWTTYTDGADSFARSWRPPSAR
jgi:DNA-binding beta-propeller fold protein YncE